jgi:hypothetical protein
VATLTAGEDGDFTYVPRNGENFIGAACFPGFVFNAPRLGRQPGNPMGGWVDPLVEGLRDSESFGPQRARCLRLGAGRRRRSYLAGGVTYLELVKQITMKPPRKYLGQFYAGEESGATPSLLTTDDFGYLRVSDSKGLRVAILDRSSGLLALFQIKPALQFLDLVGVAQDRMVSLVPELGLYSARPGRFLFWTSNAHYNAGESFQIYNLIYAGSQELSIAYDGPFLYGFTQAGNSECTTSQILRPVPAISTDAYGFPNLAMKILEEQRCWKDQIESVGGRPDFEALLHWDPKQKKYLGGSKELLRINRCRTEGKPNC